MDVLEISGKTVDEAQKALTGVPKIKNILELKHEMSKMPSETKTVQSRIQSFR